MADDPIDLGALLAPLDAGEGGAGEDLRGDFSPASIYQKLRDARAAARAEERQRDADAETEAPVAEGWRDVLQLGQRAIETRSKDFEIAAWLTEALVRHHGLPGLAAGARLISGLCDNFWENGFPLPETDLPEGEQMEGRASPLGGLSGASGDGTIMQPLRRLALFRRADATGLPVYLWDQAEETAGLANEERKAARHAAGVPELATLEAEAKLDRGFLVGTGRAARKALDAWREMDGKLNERLGSEAPSTRNVSALLERMVEVVGRLGGLEAAAETATEEAQAVVAAAPGVAAAAGAALPGPGVIRSREDALRELDRIAAWFKATEPHSPLAYTLEDAVRRGRMTLAELLAEVLPEEESRNMMLVRLGIRPTPPEY